MEFLLWTPQNDPSKAEQLEFSQTMLKKLHPGWIKYDQLSTPAGYTTHKLGIFLTNQL